jgi:hypothetical protein
MFDIRSRELRDVVDEFVVVESTKTHTGVDKPLFFSDLGDRLASRKRIIYHLIRDMPDVSTSKRETSWILEHFQRNCIIRGLQELEPVDDDIVLISDVDEIPRAQFVEALPALLQTFSVVVFEQKMTKFFLNNKSALHHNNVGWFGTVACKYSSLRGVLPQGVRLGDPFMQRAATVSTGYPRQSYSYEYRIKDGGWHFSSMGGISAFFAKNQAVVEGWRVTENIDKKGRFGLHNHREFREQHASELAQYLDAHAPELVEVKGLTSAAIGALDIPQCIKDDPRRFEHLFYLSDPIAEG